MFRTMRHRKYVRVVCGYLTAIIGGGLLLAAGLVGVSAAPNGEKSLTPHAATVAALKDVQAAIDELQKASNDTGATGSGPFRQSAHRAINDLVGQSDPRFDDSAGSSADAIGALGHFDRILHNSQSQPWVKPVTSAKVNVQAAVGRLQNALADDELQDFMLDASDALTNLDVAVGRASRSDAFGGLRGALANTTLGIPSHARVTSGCSKPSAVPAYGVKDGYVLYVAVPVHDGKAQLPENFSSSQLTVSGTRLVAYTAAAYRRSNLCGGTSASAAGDHDPVELAATRNFIRVDDAQEGVSAPAPGQPIMIAKASDASKSTTSGHHDDGLPALYTTKQAKAGKSIFQNKCVTCHGEHLQGKSAPAVGGENFLSVANRNGWTLDDLRSIVVYNMPFDNPGALTKHQYADVIAYLLAANCYPAGDKPFPEDGSDSLSKLQVESPDKIQPTNKKFGLCSVK